MIAQNLESVVFYRIAKLFIDPVGLGRNCANLAMFSKLKVLVGLKKILSYRFQYGA